MLKVNGFYGHVMRNNFRSLWIFLGFAFAFQILGGVILSLVLLFKDPTNMIFVNPVGYFMSYGLWVGIFSVVFFIGNLFLYKKNIKHDMQFSTVGNLAYPRLHKIVQYLSITAGITEPEIALINSDARNAFVCGLNQSSSTLVVTEGLLKALDDEELAAVIAHEITHIKNGDVRLMAFANVAMNSLVFLEKFNLLKIRGTKTIILMVLFPPFLILFLSAGFVSGIAMTLSKVSRLLIASSREFIADAEAVRLTHNPAALISALKKIEGVSEIEGIDPVNDAMMIDGATVGEFATHPTIVERISVLVKHSGGMAYDTRARKDTRLVHQQGFTTGRPVVGQMFGLKGRPASPVIMQAKQNDANLSVLDRVNVGSDKNTFGLTAGVKKGLIIGLVCMFGMSYCTMQGAQKAFRGLSVDGQIPHISSKIPSSGDVTSGRLLQETVVKKKVPQNLIKAQKKASNKSGFVKTEGAFLPSYYVYLGITRFDLVLVALIAMAFFAYLLIVKSFQRRRESEINRYKLGNF